MACAPPLNHPVVYVLAAGAFFFWKMTPLDFLNTYIVNLFNLHGFDVLLDFFSKSGQSGQMTMPARRASKFCAKRRAVSPEVFSQSLISWVIPGNIEPWPECQPEHFVYLAFVELGNYLRAKSVICHFYIWRGHCFRTPHQIENAKYTKMTVLINHS